MRCCDWCGSDFESSRRGVRFCSKLCSNKCNSAPRCAVRFRTCQFCGLMFSVRTSGGKPRACKSIECQADMKRQINREIERRYFEEHGEYRARAYERRSPTMKSRAAERDRLRNAAVPIRKRYPDQFAAKDARRRQSMRGASDVEQFSRIAVFETNGWICQLCEELVDRSLEYPDPLSASLDHITPISLGGKHVRSNAQLAHLICNIRKGNRIEVAS